MPHAGEHPARRPDDRKDKRTLLATREIQPAKLRTIALERYLVLRQRHGLHARHRLWLSGVQRGGCDNKKDTLHSVFTIRSLRIEAIGIVRASLFNTALLQRVSTVDGASRSPRVRLSEKSVRAHFSRLFFIA